VSITTAVFYLLATFTVLSALGVALSNNVMYSAFALMGALLGVAGTFVLLGADFLGVVQLLVYVGGILVLTVFADVRVSNRAVGRPMALVLVGAAFTWMVKVATAATWVVKAPGTPEPTTRGIGRAFLTDYILPYEIASLVLLVALIGAVVVSRKEIRA
jgi:NADH-quinone oxidoreductase subunit J